MLAYGRSKRTLRFSLRDTCDLPLGLAASARDSPPAERNGSKPDLVRPSAPSAPCSPSPHYSAGIASFPSRVGTAGTGWHGRVNSRSGSDSMDSGGSGSAMHGNQQRYDSPAPARKRFRLDMDLGPDSDSSSSDRDDGGHAQHPSSAERGELAHNYRQVAHGSDDSDVAVGSSGPTFRHRGRVAHGGSGLEQKGRHETPTHKSGQRQWQEGGGKGGQPCSQPGSAGHSNRRGGERGRAGQYLDDDRREISSFATPEHAAGECDCASSNACVLTLSRFVYL